MVLYLLFSFYGVDEGPQQSHGFIFIRGGNFLGDLQQLLLLGGQAAVGKSTLVVGESRYIVKADIVVFRQSYGTFKGELVCAFFVKCVILICCTEVVGNFLLGLVAVLP